MRTPGNSPTPGTQHTRKGWCVDWRAGRTVGGADVCGHRFQTKQDKVTELVLPGSRVAMAGDGLHPGAQCCGWGGTCAHHDPVEGWKFVPVEHDLLPLPHKLSAKSGSQKTSAFYVNNDQKAIKSFIHAVTLLALLSLWGLKNIPSYA